ncbi:MAG: hypothetical protein BHW19_01955 [Eubacterium sp. 38_16]|nr:MAG: hypothetical protein BHW19_01955 [Eubacterium sp. 38_16]
MNGKISLQDSRHNDDNFVGNCVEKVNTELKNLSESREIEKMWNQFKSRVKIVSWKISNTVML